MLSIIDEKPQVVKHFNNTFTVDILLKIFEDYGDNDLRLQAIDTISQLCKGQDKDS